MKALLHLDPATKALMGVWVSVKGAPTSYYGSDSLAAQSAGQRTLSRKLPEVSWNEYCDRLSDRTPSTIWWECVDVLPKETPRELYARMKAEAQ